MICPICGKMNRESTIKCAKCGLILTPSKVGVRNMPTNRLERDNKFAYPTSLSSGRYIIDRKLGAGGMSRVLLAKDTKMDCFVVVKELLPFFENEGEADYMMKRFKLEAKLLYRLDHAGLPKVMDYFTENERLYFIMQYIDGKTLAQLSEESPAGQLSLEKCLKWMKEITEILIYLHNQKPPVIHRDIKPHNIMIDNNDKLFLVDFGIAREVSGHSETDTTIGTYGYASPENFTGKFSLSSDMFSLGATFHMLLTGSDPRERPPFSFPPIAEYRSDTPQILDEVFKLLLDMDPDRRYENAEDLYEDLNEVIRVVSEGGNESKDKILGIQSRKGAGLISALDTETTSSASSAKSPLKPRKLQEAAAAADEKPKSLFKPRKASKKTFFENDEPKQEDIDKETNSVNDIVEDDDQLEDDFSKPMEKKPPHKSKVLFIILGLIIIGAAVFAAIFIPKMGLNNQKRSNATYALNAYSKNNSIVYQMKISLDEDNYSYSTKEVTLYEKHQAGYRVIQTFSTMEQARSIANFLNSKGISASAKEDPEDGIFVQLYGVFDNENNAKNAAQRAFEVAKIVFKVEINYNKVPYKTYLLTVPDIPDLITAEELKDKYSKFTEDIDIIEVFNNDESES